MAVNLSIKSVPDDLATRLRERAERNHRSLQGELMAIIEAAIHSGPLAPQASAPLPIRGTVVGFDRRGQPIVRKGTRRIEEIAAELRLGVSATTRHALPRSVEIVRKARDRR